MSFQLFHLFHNFDLHIQFQLCHLKFHFQFQVSFKCHIFFSVVWSFIHVAFLCLTGVPYFLCGTNILSLPDGGVNRVMGKPGWAKELSS